MKKLTKATLSVFLFVLMFAVSGIQAQAASKAEIESMGTRMRLNQEAKGVLTSKEDENWFIFDVTQPGYFNLTMNTSYADPNAIDAGWDIFIYDANDLVNCVKSYGRIKTTYTTASFPMHIGTYYVKIDASDTYSDNYAPTNCQYGLTVNYKVDAAWEAEYNNESNVANIKNVNSVIKGNLYHREDVDWYKFTVDKAGVFQVDFAPTDYVDVEAIDAGWRVEFFDSSFTQIRCFGGIKTSYTSPKYAFAAGTYYVRVNASDSYSDGYAPTACDYLLTLKHTVDKSWESEWNNTSTDSDAIAVGKNYHGTLHYCNDNDWYKFNLNKNGIVKLDFAKEANVSIEEVHAGWDVYIISAKTNQIVLALDAVKTSGSQQVALIKGAYYVKVCPQDTYSDSYAPTSCQYDFKVSFTQSPSKTKITSIKSSKKKVTLKWKKVSGANGYYIYRSTSKKGTYKKVATIKKGSTVKYTDKKGLKKKKTYYYKIVAYKKANGITATSADSAVKKVKVK
ncbi:MAG: hypothetical protein E7264_03385 [Lachnospiraceae bacterium]|nr:hypothetical protein [Lachnospiraceae bacterium]